MAGRSRALRAQSNLHESRSDSDHLRGGGTVTQWRDQTASRVVVREQVGSWANEAKQWFATKASEVSARMPQRDSLAVGRREADPSVELSERV